jgi:hypothetical protein
LQPNAKVASEQRQEAVQPGHKAKRVWRGNPVQPYHSAVDLSSPPILPYPLVMPTLSGGRDPRNHRLTAIAGTGKAPSIRSAGDPYSVRDGTT